MYQSSLKSNQPCDSLEDITQELPCKKTGRPLLIGEELDCQVQEYIREARKRELAINASVVICAGHGIMMNKHANQLNDVHGEIKHWAKNLLRRMGFVKRKACSQSKINVEDFDKVKKDFLLEVKSIVMMDCHITAVFGGTMTGDFFTTAIIYEGETKTMPTSVQIPSSIACHTIQKLLV